MNVKFLYLKYYLDNIWAGLKKISGNIPKSGKLLVSWAEDYKVSLGMLRDRRTVPGFLMMTLILTRTLIDPYDA